MNTSITSKVAALAVALMMNTLIIGGVAILFNGQLHHQNVESKTAHTALYSAA